MRCIKPLAPSRNETNSSRVNGGADKLCAIPQICAYGGQDQVGFDCLTQKSPLPAAVRHRRRGRIGAGFICDACRAYCNLTCPGTPPSVGLLLHEDDPNQGDRQRKQHPVLKGTVEADLARRTEHRLLAPPSGSESRPGKAPAQRVTANLALDHGPASQGHQILTNGPFRFQVSGDRFQSPTPIGRRSRCFRSSIERLASSWAKMTSKTANARTRRPTSTAASTIGVGGVDGGRAGRAMVGKRDPQ
jgi:hypothetical protein